MINVQRAICYLIFAILALAPRSADARDLKIAIPRRSQLTPVQKLNREGVEAIRKHAYDKAENLFYKAYLYDPADPFTLNNLGYVSELQGQLDRAQQFYKLASEQASDAAIAASSSDSLRGKPMRSAVSDLHDARMQINQANVESIRLLSQRRAQEAESLLRQTLTLDPKNPFTLNNLALALEAQGNFDAALRDYTEVAQTHASDPVIVTLSPSWRGKAVSEMAAASAKRLRDRMTSEQSAQAQAAELNLRGVSAVNRNDWPDAERDFQRAYKLDPHSAFSINNIGYVSEKEGDLETAEFFYEKARTAESANATVGVATRRSAEGMRLSEVASDGDQKVDETLIKEAEIKRRQPGAIELRRRDGQPIEETPQSAPPDSSSPAPQAAPSAPLPQHP